MEFNEEAKQEIEKYLDEIIKYINADEKERAEMANELRSNLYESAESAAKARGSTVVMPEDVKTARSVMVSPKETSESLMISYAAKLRKAGFWSRLAAYIIDNVVICMTIIILAIPMLIICLPLGFTMNSAPGSNPNPFMLATFLSVLCITAILAMAIYFGYYLFLEGRFGYTVGKYLLGLRVLKTDGTKISYRESLLRNISKYIKNLIIIDTLIMLIFFNQEKQRGFDKVANTMVVHVRA